MQAEEEHEVPEAPDTIENSFQTPSDEYRAIEAEALTILDSLDADLKSPPADFGERVRKATQLVSCF